MTLKVASFHVSATVEQSRRWKIAAEAEGFQSVGAWLARAADAYLKARARAGLPMPLEWRKAHFRVELASGETLIRGFVSPPFGAFRGTETGRGVQGRHRFTLVYVPAKRILATVRTFGQCKVLAAELAPVLLRGNLPDPAPIIDRHQRESV